MAASTWRTATSTAGTPTRASPHGKTVTSKALGALDHAPGETTPPATASKAPDRLANILGHDTTQTAITSKALDRLADLAVRDILAHVRSLG